MFTLRNCLNFSTKRFGNDIDVYTTMAVLMKRCDQNNSFCVAPLPKYIEFGSLKQAAQLSPKAALFLSSIIQKFAETLLLLKLSLAVIRKQFRLEWWVSPQKGRFYGETHHANYVSPRYWPFRGEIPFSKQYICTEKESLSKCFLRGNRNIIPKDKCTRNGFVLV